jgi:hypothetical protein
MAAVLSLAPRRPDTRARAADARAVAEASVALAALGGEGACLRFLCDAETLAR